jgi:hypothetical protein
MERQLRESFLKQWKEYFATAELPIAYYYAAEVTREEIDDSENEHRCLICNLNQVREGHTFVYSSNSPGCLGGKRYTGFSQELRSNFEYFLSCGIPGKMEGEHYKKSPELVEQQLKHLATRQFSKVRPKPDRKRPCIGQISLSHTEADAKDAQVAAIGTIYQTSLPALDHLRAE